MATTYGAGLCGIGSVVKASNTQLETLETVSKTEFQSEIGTYRLLPKEQPSNNTYQAYEWIDENGQPMSNADVEEDTEATGQTRSTYGLRQTAIPESYDLRDYNRITSVKNQGKDGACWTFSAIASLESNMLTQGISDYQALVGKDENPDGSERHLAYFAKNRDINGDMIQYEGEELFSSGGNWNFAVGTLGRGSGIEREDHAEYVSSGVANQPVDEEHEYHRYANLKNLITYGNDQSTIKRAIMEKGAVASTYYTNDDYFYCKDAATIGIAYFHSNSEEEQDGNHAITIAGWDDHYPKENFAKSKGAVADGIMPQQDGAWLVKNSWGENWGKKSENAYVNQEGYFWISYEENSLQEFVTYEAAKSDSYDKNYGYDGVGNYQLVYFPTKAITGANVFTLPSVEELCSVAFYSNNEHLEYTIRIYNEVVSDPDTGILLYTQTGQLERRGYYTIDLDTPLVLEGKIAVAVTFDVPEEYKETEQQGYLPVEGAGVEAGGGNTIICSSQKGESYYYTGIEWEDASNPYNNICIKALTKEISQEEEEWKHRLENLIEEANAMIEDECYVEGYRMTDLFQEFLEAKKQGEDVMKQGQEGLYQESCLDLMETYRKVLANYITIDTEEEFRQIAIAVNNRTASYSDTYVALMKDMDMTNSEPWIPIGVLLYGMDVRVFQGTFDGDGHTIKNLNLTEYVSEESVNQQYVQTGLFGVLGNRGVVRNLNIEGMRFAAVSSHSGSRCGSIAGMNFGTIENCSVKGTISSAESGTKTYVGGIAAQNMGIIAHCYSVATFTGEGYYVGGITAWNNSKDMSRDWNNGTIQNCYSIAEMNMSLEKNGVMTSIVTYNGGVMTNNYYIENNNWKSIYWQEGTSSNLKSLSQIQVASGEAAYIMNTEEGNPQWSQDFAKKYPVPADKYHGATYAVTLSDQNNILAEEDRFRNRTYANAGDTIVLNMREGMSGYLAGIRCGCENDNCLSTNNKGQYIMPERCVENLEVIRIRKGSLNGDDEVTAVDALLALKEVNCRDGKHNCYFIAARNDDNEDITIKDVLRILNMASSGDGVLS